MTGKISEDSALGRVPYNAQIPHVSSGTNYSDAPTAFFNMVDARSYGVLSANSAATNLTNIQAAIDAMSAVGGGILYLSEPVACSPGIVLKMGVHLMGNNRFVGKGPPANDGSTGGTSATPGQAAFLITGTGSVFILMQSCTSIEGILFMYPNQDVTTYASRIDYPYTITGDPNSPDTLLQQVSIKNCGFFGATGCISLTDAGAVVYLFDIEIDLCYGYPYLNSFIEIGTCVDIPRITRCHVNPGMGWPFRGSGTSLPVSQNIMDGVVANAAASYYIHETDEFIVSQCFAFGVKTAFQADNSYGTFLQCSADQVETAYQVSINSAYKALVISAPGMMIPCAGIGNSASRNGVVFQGTAGTLKLDNLHATLGGNPVLTTSAAAHSFLKVAGAGAQRVFLTACTAADNGGTWANMIDQVNGSAIISGSPTNF
jgi:hypothetical protein